MAPPPVLILPVNGAQFLPGACFEARSKAEESRGVDHGSTRSNHALAAAMA